MIRRFLRPLQGAVIRITGERHAALDMAHSRAMIVFLAFTLLYLALCVRALDLALIRPAFHQKPALSASLQTPEVEMRAAIERGNIYDRNGAMLATSLPVTSLYADPLFIEEPRVAAQALSAVFSDLNEDKLYQEFSGRKRFIPLKTALTPEQIKQVLAIGEPGFQFQEKPRRFYPHGERAAHLLGFTGRDHEGLAGIERLQESDLKAGEDVALTIDIRVQHLLDARLEAAIKDFEAKGGAALVMDIKTGEILAASSFPSFDPNHVAKSDMAAQFNTLFRGVYEMGSTFKIFSTAALIEEYNPPFSKEYDASQPLIRGRFKIHDFHAQDRVMTIPELFIHSSNIGSALIGEELGTERLLSFYKDLGLLDPVQTDIGVSVPPLLPQPWRDINTITASYGHGMAVTPLHLAQAVATIVGGGERVRPRFIMKDDSVESVSKIPTSVRIMTEESAHKMRQLMRLVVKQGTGKKAEVLGYGVGGKTGTAEKIVNGRYDSDIVMSSFVGVFPVHAPQYLIFAMVDEPKGQKESFGYATGGWVAAPIIKDVVAGMAKLYGLPPLFNASRDAALTDPLLAFMTQEDERESALME